MQTVSGIVIYVILWWVIFFMALPLGIQQPTQVEEGHDRGAPKKTYLIWKILGTSIISACLWVLVVAFIRSLRQA